MINLGCSNNENSSFENNEKLQQFTPEEFGVLHNEYLLKAIEYSNTDPSLSNKEAFMLVLFPNITKKIQSAIYDEISKTSIEQMKDTIFNRFKNPLAKVYFEEIDIALDDAKNYSELDEQLNVIVPSVNENLIGIC